MEELRAYLNSLTPDEQARYANLCGTTIGYLRNAIAFGKRFDGALARKLDENSGGVVKKQVLRPDIWPELTQKNNHPIMIGLTN